MTLRNGTLTVASFVSVILFPWPLSVFLAVAASFFEPLLPIAVGLFADTLYYAPEAAKFPVFTMYGLIWSTIVVLVRSRLRTGTMLR